jgi:hypothetical protein
MRGNLSKNNVLQFFLKGFVSAFDITGGVKTPDLADGDAVRGDWQRVGNDMCHTMDIVSRERAEV